MLSMPNIDACYRSIAADPSAQHEGQLSAYSGHLLVCSQKPRKEKTDQPQKWYCMASSILAAMYKAMNKRMLEMSFISPGP